MTNETAPQKPKTANFSVKTDMVGFSRTQQVEITETVLGETSGFIIKLVIEKSRTQGFPGGPIGPIVICKRCIIDIDTGIETCHPVPCPIATPPPDDRPLPMPA